MRPTLWSGFLLVGCGDPPTSLIQGGECGDVDVTGTLYWSATSPEIGDEVTIEGSLDYGTGPDPGVLEVRVLGVEAAGEGSLRAFSVTLDRARLEARVDSEDGAIVVDSIEVVDACGAREVRCGGPCATLHLAPEEPPAEPPTE